MKITSLTAKGTQKASNTSRSSNKKIWDGGIKSENKLWSGLCSDNKLANCFKENIVESKSVIINCLIKSSRSKMTI
jgi:hypothetical protein